MKKSLTFSEFLFLFSFLVLVALFFILAKGSHTSVKPEVVQSRRRYAVEVEGAVAKPGSYRVPKGTPIAKILKKARPSRLADLSGIDLSATVGREKKIVVPELKELLIRVEGAVESAEDLILPLNARICDLKKRVVCTPDADLTYFRRKRRLKHRETISVPQKKKVE